MIDFHSHILPNIDDGSKSLEESLDMLKEAKSVGFTDIISTSHYINNRYEADVSQRKKLINEIVKNCKEEDIKLNIYLGNEIYISENFMDLLQNKKTSTINNTKYVLFEMPLNGKLFNLYNIVYDILSNGMVPILAHPERYTYIQNNPEILYDLVEKGILLQSNYCSILGVYGIKAKIIVKKLLENDMIQFLGSDVHRKNTIYPMIPKALKKISKIIKEDKLKEISIDNPKLVLEDKKIKSNKIKKIKFSLAEKFLLNLSKK